MPPTIVVNGQLSLLSPRQAAAALGGYYVATNPTPGTGVLFGTVTGFSATADGMFTVANTNAANGRTIYLDALSLHMSGTAPTATTVAKLAVFLENKIVAPTAGNVAITPQPLNPAVSPTSGATINGFSSAAMTIPAAVGTRTLVANTSLPTSLGITGDSYVFAFGGDPAVPVPGLTAVRATAAGRIVTQCAPVTVPPGYTAIIDFWWLTQATNGPTLEFELGYYEL